MNNYSILLHGSAISNANVLDDVVKGKADVINVTDSTFTGCHNQNTTTEKPIDNLYCSRYDNIINAKQHSSHGRADHVFASTNEGKNEEMRGMTAPALQ